MIRTDKRMRLCIALLICILIFIWGNSALPGQISGAFSDWVKEMLAHILPGGEETAPGGGLLRKMAHFTEFTALGALLTWLFGMLRKKGVWPLILGAAAACVDESMKKLISALLAVAMMAALLTGCGSSSAQETTASTTAAVVSVEGTMEELINKVVEIQPVEFGAAMTNLDLTDTSEEGLWNIKRFTGLDNADQIVEAAAYEPMIGSIAFSMVMVRVAPGEDSKAVAEAMKAGIDPRKWICVEADDLMVTGYGDVVMLIMVSSAQEITAQSFVDAFAQVVGAEPDFQLS